MARLPRICLPGIPQHIIQRGINREACFASEEDFAAYTHWLEECALKNGVAVHAWVFMTNHVHLLVTPESPDSVSRMMQALGRHYVPYFNGSYRRTGTLWEGRFKSCVVEEENYFLVCQKYIELNPVRAGMVEAPGDYKWSSFRLYGFGHSMKLGTPHQLYLNLGTTGDERMNAYRELFADELDRAVLHQIRQVSNQGMVLGNDRFKSEIERLTGRRTNLLKRGPKPRADA